MLLSYLKFTGKHKTSYDIKPALTCITLQAASCHAQSSPLQSLPSL